MKNNNSRYNRRKEMDDISGLMADMILKGANLDEFGRAINHSMAVIHAGRLGIDLEKCARENGIAELKEKYQDKPSIESRSIYPKKIVFNDPMTIVYWSDETKTSVRCEEGTKFSEYHGYLAALGKKLYDGNGNLMRTIERKKVVVQKKIEQKRENDSDSIETAKKKPKLIWPIGRK